jgi:hypothetical protein
MRARVCSGNQKRRLRAIDDIWDHLASPVFLLHLARSLARPACSPSSSTGCCWCNTRCPPTHAPTHPPWAAVVRGTSHFVRGTSCLALRAGHFVRATSCVALRARHFVRGTSCVALRAWHFVRGTSCVALRAWHLVRGTCCVLHHPVAFFMSKPLPAAVASRVQAVLVSVSCFGFPGFVSRPVRPLFSGSCTGCSGVLALVGQAARRTGTSRRRPS